MGSLSPSINDPMPNVDHILNCQIHVWYHRHRRWTIKSRILDLSPEFIAYLHQDEFFLPPGAKLQPIRRRHYDDDSSSSSGWSSNGDDAYERPEIDSNSDESASLPEFNEIPQVRAIIDELGGAVLPKMNWSSPKDATWITCTGTMKCVTPCDVILLLKASEFIQHDLTQP